VGLPRFQERKLVHAIDRPVRGHPRPASRHLSADLWQIWMDGTPDEASATLVAAPEADLA
jgi:hypothetical protein